MQIIGILSMIKSKTLQLLPQDETIFSCLETCAITQICLNQAMYHSTPSQAHLSAQEVATLISRNR